MRTIALSRAAAADLRGRITAADCAFMARVYPPES